MPDLPEKSLSCSLQLLISTFESLFIPSQNTQLVPWGAEPIYLPACTEKLQTGAEWRHNRIIFTQDYFSSALHEVAHWCVAGAERRKQEDYGYWYAPDGRTADQQVEFEKVEVKPQAMEWMFTKACGRSFRVSADNLTAGLGASDEFKHNIWRQVQSYCSNGLPDRANSLVLALADAFGQTSPFLEASCYQIAELDDWGGSRASSSSKPNSNLNPTSNSKPSADKSCSGQSTEPCS